MFQEGLQKDINGEMESNENLRKIKYGRLKKW